MSGHQKLPNIIFIVMDTVGAKHMSLYGYPRRTTPNLDRIAAECAVYDRCFAPSCWTIPSHASMFTGLYPSQHGAHEANFFLNSNRQHMVSVLKMAGYNTFGIVCNGLVSSESGLCRDFDKLKVFGGRGFAPLQDKFARSKGKAADGLLPRVTKVLTTKERILEIIKYFYETRNYQQGFQDLLKLVKYKLNQYINPSPFHKSSNYTVTTVNLFNEILKEHYNSKNGAPYFFFLNFIEAHEIYKPPVRTRHFSRYYDRQSHRVYRFYKQSNSKLSALYNNLYDDEIYFLDQMMSKLWNIITQFPDFDNTVVIVTSDHGEHFGEKGLYGHSLSLYNELIWVPLMIKFPKSWAMRGLDNRLVSLNDCYSTVLDLADSPFPRPESSLSLLGGSMRDMVISQVIFPGIWGGQMKAKKETDSGFYPPTMAIINNNFKKIIEKNNNTLELYDLNKDINEEHNLINTMPSDVKQNLNQLIEYLKSDTGYNEAIKQLNIEDLAAQPLPATDF